MSYAVSLIRARQANRLPADGISSQLFVIEQALSRQPGTIGEEILASVLRHILGDTERRYTVRCYVYNHAPESREWWEPTEAYAT